MRGATRSTPVISTMDHRRGGWSVHLHADHPAIEPCGSADHGDSRGNCSHVTAAVGSRTARRSCLPPATANDSQQSFRARMVCCGQRSRSGCWSFRRRRTTQFPYRELSSPSPQRLADSSRIGVLSEATPSATPAQRRSLRSQSSGLHARGCRFAPECLPAHSGRNTCRGCRGESEDGTCP